LPTAYDTAHNKSKSKKRREKIPSQKQAALDHRVQGLIDHVGMVI